MHLPGAKTPKMVHPAINSCVTHYINLFKSWENHAHTGCTGFKIHAPLISNTDKLYNLSSAHVSCTFMMNSDFQSLFLISDFFIEASLTFS